MRYDRELQFTEKILSRFRLKIRYIESNPDMNTSTSPIGLSDILNYTVDNDALFHQLSRVCSPNTIYQISTPLMCEYMVFLLPESTPPAYAYIGPYTHKIITGTDILNLANIHQVGPNNLLQLEQYYQDLPLITDNNLLITLLYTLGEVLWGSMDHFSFQKIDSFVLEDIMHVSPLPDIATPEEALLSMQILEERYQEEHNLIQAVSAGQTHKAELAYNQLASRQLELRTSDSLRNRKNYAYVLNTVLRLAAESGSVHPIHIDNISSKYARQIETLTSEEACEQLTKEMVHKYCLLVKNHSLKGYSLLVRKVITRIDTDLATDLSLKAQADLLNVNSSYLSTLFKKETGVTLTEYVNRKRIEHALFLLNSTNMQIQLIAQYCGIPDVNYFTKTFKKLVGKTPKEYREMISSKL